MQKNFKTLNINEIKIQNRKRNVSNIESLADSIKKVGLLSPIIVNEDLKLVAGLHRLEAYKKLGETEIPAIIINANELQAELIEIDENIARTELTELEKSEQLKRRKEIYEQLYPEATASAVKESNLPKRNNCVSGEVEPKAKSFTQDTAEKTGESKRTVQLSLQIAQNITPEAKEKIKGTALENKKIALVKVARTEPTKQLEVIEELQNKALDKKPKKYVQLSLLDTSYKVDFVKRLVVVGDTWLDLPSEYNMDKNSYEVMVLVAKNYKQNKDKSAASS